MKTKEELLKIYSAYLPYELECEVKDQEQIKTDILSGVYDNGDLVFHNTIESHHGFESIKPILYSMDYFEKYFSKLWDEDIDVRTFLNQDFLLDHNFSDIQDMITNYKIEWIPLGVINLCLKHHFNVFGLSDSEYIKKETLKQ